MGLQPKPFPCYLGKGSKFFSKGGVHGWGAPIQHHLVGELLLGAGVALQSEISAPALRTAPRNAGLWRSLERGSRSWANHELWAAAAATAQQLLMQEEQPLQRSAEAASWQPGAGRQSRKKGKTQKHLNQGNQLGSPRWRDCCPQQVSALQGKPWHAPMLASSGGGCSDFVIPSASKGTVLLLSLVTLLLFHIIKYLGFLDPSFWL